MTDDKEEICVEYVTDGHSGCGWYYWYYEYPEEGSSGPYDTRERAVAVAEEASESGVRIVESGR